MQLRRVFKRMYNMKEMLYVSTCRKTSTKLLLYAILFLLAVTISFSPYMWQKKSPLPRQMKFQTDLKYILFWKGKEKRVFPNIARETQFPIGQSLFIKQKCQYINCYITYNKSLLKYDWYFDAIVFNIHYMRHNRARDYNLTRASYQKYIFQGLESAENRPICPSFYENFFNWTWSYKLDSDLPSPFLNIYDRSNVLIGPKRNITWIERMNHTDRFTNKIKYKTDAIAWIIGRCKLKEKHKDFFKELKDELKGYNLTIDTYGPCGENKCPRGALYKCYKMIEKKYYFQLVFEDSFAEDYVTEVIVKVMQLTIIPIVLGGADYRNFLPPGTYINAQEFDLKKLGAIIDYLIQNPKIYAYFFDWKNYYFYNLRPRNYVCDLCAKLNDMDSPAQSIDNFRLWWNPNYEDICIRDALYYKFTKENAASTSTYSMDT